MHLSWDEGSSTLAFSTARIEGVVTALFDGQDSHCHRLHQVVHKPTGTLVSPDGEREAGLLSLYKVLARSSYLTELRVQRPEVLPLESGLCFRWTPTLHHQAYVESTVEVQEPNIIDVGLKIEGYTSYSDYEVYLNSYVAPGFTPVVYLQDKNDEAEQVKVIYNDVYRGMYNLFPRDMGAAKLLYDGRGQSGRHNWWVALGRMYGLPLGSFTDGTVDVVVMGRRRGRPGGGRQLRRRRRIGSSRRPPRDVPASVRERSTPGTRLADPGAHGNRRFRGGPGPTPEAVPGVLRRGGAQTARPPRRAPELALGLVKTGLQRERYLMSNIDGIELRKLVCNAEFKPRWESYSLDDLAPDEVRVRSELSAAKHGTEMARILGTGAHVNVRYMADRKHFDRTRESFYDSKQWVGTGNATVGTVIAVGAEVRDLKEGDRVWRGGGFQTVHQGKGFRKLVDGFSAAAACCMDPANYALGPVRDGNVRAGERVLVLGMGAIGLFAVQLARISGAIEVVAVDPIAARARAGAGARSDSGHRSA